MGKIERGWLTAVTAVAVAAYSAWIWAGSFVADGVRFWTLRDDAMISMTYARTFAEGHGLVWHPGADAVEGYTNFGWTLWMALIHAVGVPDRLTSLVVLVTGAALLIACGWMAAALARRLGFGTAGAVVAAALTTACYPLVYWTLTGMEVGLLAALALAIALAADRLRECPTDRTALVGLCGAIGFGVLTRTDFVIVAAVVCLWLAWQRGRWAPPAAAALVTLVGHTVFRVAYYGDPLPNTYYLKMTGLPLAQRVFEGLDAALALVPGLTVAVIAAVAGCWAARRRPLWALLAALGAGQVAYSVWVGGDAWESYGFANRYIAVGLPALLVLASGASRWLSRRGVRPALAAAFTLVVVTVTSSWDTATRWLPEVGPTVTDFQQERYALELAEAVPPGTSVTVTWAGAIPYFSRTHGVDLLGKMDPVVAHGPVQPDSHWLPVGHRKWDYSQSIEQVRPDVVPWLWARADATCSDMPSLGYLPDGHGGWVLRSAPIEPHELPDPIEASDRC